MRLNKKFFETKDFKKLDKEWKQKLKESGFKDTETESNIQNNTVVSQEFKVRPEWIVYNKKCIAFLDSGVITDQIDLFIFRLHCEGATNLEITYALGRNTAYTMDRRTVDRRLIKILKTANIEPIDFGNI